MWQYMWEPKLPHVITSWLLAGTGFFDPPGCTQPMTTLHTSSIPPKETACTLLTWEGQVPVSTPPVITTPNSLTSQSYHMYWPPTLYTVIPVSPVLHLVAVLLPPAKPNTPSAPRGISPQVPCFSMP